MTQLSETKKNMGLAFKNTFSRLSLPGEVSKKVSTKMRMEAKLKNDSSVIIACAEVKSSRVPGNYGLYWLFSLSDGPIYKCMKDLNLDVSQNFSGSVIIRGTSHNFNSGESHYEITPDINFEQIASKIKVDIEKFCFPIIDGFVNNYLEGVNFIKNNGAGHVRNPFVTSIILLGLSNNFELVDDVVVAAQNNHKYYDFHAIRDYRSEILEPIKSWFLT